MTLVPEHGKVDLSVQSLKTPRLTPSLDAAAK
jgi:hypothetical protein